MGRAGDSKTFLALAAALMAGLVIATMLAINAKLQSALAPTVEQAGAPAIKMIPPAAAPLLQSTVAPSIANSVPNSGTNSFNNSTAAPPNLVASPKARAVAPAATKRPVATVPAPSNATQVTTPAAPPVPVAATATVTVVPEPDVGDGVASTGETHRGQRRHRDGSNPDLTAVPTGPDAAGDSEIRPAENEGDGDAANPDGNDDAHPQCPGDDPDPDHGEKHG
jgi:hypothetical protein